MKISKQVKIQFVKDRPGHDFRYALNSKKILKELKWKPKRNFESGLDETLSSVSYTHLTLPTILLV